MLFWWRRSGTQLFEIRARYHDDGSFPTCWVRNIDNVDLQWGGAADWPSTTGGDRVLGGQGPRAGRLRADCRGSGSHFTGPLVAPGGGVELRKVLPISCPFRRPRGVGPLRYGQLRARLSLSGSGSLKVQQGPYSPEKYNGMLEKIVISARRLPETEKVFRMGESPTHLLSTLEFKREVEKRAITGIEFTQLRVSE